MALWGSAHLSVDDVYRHICIHDYAAAADKASLLAQQTPESAASESARIRALSLAGRIDEALAAFDENNPGDDALGDPTKRSLVEEMAWGVLSREANQLHVHMSSIVGAACTQDARALPILLKSMSSSNALIRSVGLRFAAQYRDAQVVDKLLEMLDKETVWYVRLQLLETIGGMQLERALPHLNAIVCDTQASMEERHKAIAGLCFIRDTAALKDIARFAESARVGERQLACQLVLHFSLKEGLGSILPLVTDASPEVRIAAINTCTLLAIQSESFDDALMHLMRDSQYEVAITAAWGLAMRGREEGALRLFRLVDSQYAYERRIAAGALSLLSDVAAEKIDVCIRKHRDPFVRATLARAMLCRGRERSAYLEEIASFLDRRRQKIMMMQSMNPLFHMLSESAVSYSLERSQFPLFVDRMTRLELVNLLAVKRYKGVDRIVRRFLQESQLGVSLSASLILAQEGSEEALDLMNDLIQDPDASVQLQAALVLAHMGECEKARPILLKQYETASREVKLQILQALGQISDRKSARFLLSVMREPFLVLRACAASSLIQSMYN